jgi:hypothetical protein
MADKGGTKKGHVMPKEKWEKDAGSVMTGGHKYASESTMGNPEDLKESVNKLSGYLKSHKMKY